MFAPVAVPLCEELAGGGLANGRRKMGLEYGTSAFDGRAL